MNIFVHSDESGVFDRQHNSWFVFGGVFSRPNTKQRYLDYVFKIAVKRKLYDLTYA